MGLNSVDRKTDEVPDDVYIQFVRSLFDNAHMLLIGGACYGIISVMIAHYTENPVFMVFALVLLIISLWRYLDIRQFHTAGGIIRDVAEAKRWEGRYILGGTLLGLVLGSLVFTTIYVSRNDYAQLASLSMVTGSLVTVVGRNYGSARMVRIFSLSFIGPAALALLLRGDLPHIVLGLMIVPLTFLTMESAAYLRQVLFSAVTGHRRASQLAQRFDRALNTMPQGLFMFNPSGRIIVANAEAAHLLGMPSPDRLLGRSMDAVLRRIVAAGKLDKVQWRFAASQLAGALKGGLDRKLMIELTDGRSFELSTREGDQNIGVVMFEDVTSRVRAEKRIIAMARFDSLTTLPNRAYLHELVAERLATGDPHRNCALAMFDLDDFKGVNDTLGHSVGDGLVRTVGDRLSKIASHDILVGRFGGDEFLVYCDNVESEDSLRALMATISNRLRGDVDIAGNRVRLQSSGGAVSRSVADADIDTMIIQADLALSSAKEQGKNGWRLFEPQLEQAFRNRQTLKADLRTAVESGGLRVVYQPIVSLETMRIASCEALCRWDHPELGPISPALFIPLSEDMGIVSQISTFVLGAACEECAKWPEPITVSVNLSAKDFAGPEIIYKVRTALEAAGLAPERLEIEVTETSLLDEKSQARHYVEELRMLGVCIALDDFGTGYSSLSYLHRLPLDKIKIDRSFLFDVVQDARSLELLAGIVKLSRRLGLSVTVEGVETFQQLKVLADRVKPDLAQGFLFGSALTASGIETMSTTSWPFANDGSKADRPVASRA